MRPIPWILVAVVLTAAGIFMTYEGQTTIRPERRIPSRWPGQRGVDVAALTAGMPGYHSLGAEGDTDEPEKPKKPRHGGWPKRLHSAKPRKRLREARRKPPSLHPPRWPTARRRPTKHLPRRRR